MKTKLTWIAPVVLAVMAFPVRTEEAGKPVVRPSGKADVTNTISALVQQVDLAKREVTLKETDGTVFVISVGPEVKNLADVKKDDLIVAKLSESLTWQVSPPGQAARPMREEASGDLGKPGERPMGIRKKTTAGTVTIAAKDSKAGTLTIREMGGKTKVLTFRDPKNVELLKPGDQVDVVYTETMAVMVEKAPKKNK